MGLTNPLTDMHFNMCLLYTIVSVIHLAAYGKVILDQDEGGKTSLLYAFNLHWFRIIIKMLDLEGLEDHISN